MLVQIGESWAECALRETKEETNLDVGEAKCLLVTNDLAMGGNPDKHYITIIMHTVMDPTSAVLENCEPQKCAGWEWVSWAELQEKVATDDSDFFEPAAKAIRELRYPFEGAAFKCL